MKIGASKTADKLAMVVKMQSEINMKVQTELFVLRVGTDVN